MNTAITYQPSLEHIKKAATRLEQVVHKTPITRSLRLSQHFNCQVYLKREDLQSVRSYKIRGAYNKMASMTEEEVTKGVICASAGNHAQGVALSCKLLEIEGTIYMPATTPMQKIEQVKMFGESFVTIKLEGDTFDDSHQLAVEEAGLSGKIFVHPFDDQKVIEGQATVGLEILQNLATPIDYVFVPIGGGGLAAGLSTVFHYLSPNTKIIGVEPEGAAAMKTSMSNGRNTTLNKIEKFVDGAAVKRVGDTNFHICKELLFDVVTVPEGKICQTILDLYNKDAIIVEPAGALSMSALDHYAEELRGKNVVCVVSGSNNDITRTAEIKERALLFSNLKHYFIVTFPQRAGALRQFVAEVLGPDADITHFEYTKKTNREDGSAVVGIELKSTQDLQKFL